MMIQIKIAILMLVIFTFVSCSGGEMEQNKFNFNSLKDVSDEAWQQLSKKKIYFGHRSVGANIIDGMKDLMQEYPKIQLNIVETTVGEQFKEGVFAHSFIGQNADPKSKLNDFSKYVEEGIGSNADIAALKFCYVDMSSETDIHQVFQDYKNEIAKLQKMYPDLTIVHFTEPLSQLQTGWKASIKKLIGKPLGGVADNMKRTEYNDLLTKEYKGKHPIFDIAEIESTYPDGRRNSFEKDGKTYYSLVPDYTDDGGHLNELGRQKVAEKLLLALVNLN